MDKSTLNALQSLSAQHKAHLDSYLTKLLLVPGGITGYDLTRLYDLKFRGIPAITEWPLTASLACSVMSIALGCFYSYLMCKYILANAHSLLKDQSAEEMDQMLLPFDQAAGLALQLVPWFSIFGAAFCIGWHYL